MTRNDTNKKADQTLKIAVASSGEGRYSSLDSLRGVAILLVMFGHFIPQAFPETKFPLVSTFGGAGVLLFFYLSGFLIYRSIQTQTVFVFMVRRLFNLMPAYWVSIVFVVILVSFQQGKLVPDFKTLLSNVLLIQDVVRVELLSGVYWTLLIEAKFYVLIVIFSIVFGKTRMVWLFFFLFAINISLYYSIGRGSLLTTYLISFFPGVLAARILIFQNSLRHVLEYWILGVLSVFNLYIFLPLAGQEQAVYALIFLGVFFVGLRQDFSSHVLEFFGRISYSHYLFHASIGYPLIDYIAANGGLPLRILALIITSVVTVGVATISYYVVEKMAVDIGHRVSRSEFFGLGQIVSRVD